MAASGPHRLGTHRHGSPVEFTYNGRQLHGVEGDTVASALLANGIRVVSRSFKFHRPRGIYSAGFEEPNALVRLHSGASAIPSARATLIPLTPGLEVRSQSGWPSTSWDLLRAIDFIYPLVAAGFYNKTFIWPSWRVYEPAVRRLAGLGRAPDGPDPDRYETRHAHCDVLVVGGGRAGLGAAIKAVRAGKRVILAEQQDCFGGDTSPLTGNAGVQLLTRTTAVAHYDHQLVALVESVEGAGEPGLPRERLWLARAEHIVLATGAIEQPLVFCNNDRPGIMLMDSALQYLRRHMVAPGRRVLLATNNGSAYRAARELKDAGVNVVALADSRPSSDQDLRAELDSLDIPLLAASMPIDTHGFGALHSVSVGTFDAAGGVVGIRHLKCDSLLVSGGFSPTLHLFAQAGGKLRYDARTRAYRAVENIPGMEILGSEECGPSGELGMRVSPVGNAARKWLDLRHDVAVSDIELAIRENYTAVEHIKRYTTLGMSVDQGKVGQAPASEVLAAARGISVPDLGHSTFRPPFMPVTLGTMVGRNVGQFFSPTRETPLHQLQAEAGALFEDFGEWKRAAVFPRHRETRDQATQREIHLVRNGVGLFDASPLGKIELAGPDALDFIDRFYINNLLTLKTGRARYAIMLQESGVVFDDGTVTILDEDRVLITTTSSGAGRIAAWLEEWRQCEWPDARVAIFPVTDAWATVSISGQSARAVLERLKPDCDLSNGAFPHLGMRVAKCVGNEARIYRVSFSGELTYEINVPSTEGPRLWSALLEEGRDFGIAPYGVDALLHLRMEKGFIHIGADTDGTTVPDDIGFGAPALHKARHYIGKRSLALPENVRPDRLQLVGLSGLGDSPLPVGGHVRLPASREPTDGWITSGGLLSNNGRPIALAMLRRGRERLEKAVSVYDAGNVVAMATVVKPIFYDPAGARMNG